MADTQDIQFGVFRLKNSLSELYRGDEFLEAEARVVHLIALLVQAYPSTLSRRELLDLLWPQQEISDASLTQLIRRARLLLGDNGRQPEYIKTVHGVGVRFLMEPITIEPLGKIGTASLPPTHHLPIPPVGEKPKKRGWLRPVSFLLPLLFVSIYYYIYSGEAVHGAAQVKPMLALMPIENSGKDEAYQWVEWGLMDMLGHQLEQTQVVSVITSKDMSQYLSGKDLPGHWGDRAGMKEDFAKICGAIGCDYLLLSRIKISAGLSRLEFYLLGKKGLYPEQLALGKDPLQAGDNLLKQVISLLQPEHALTQELQDTYSTNAVANQSYALGMQSLLRGSYVRAQRYFALALEEEATFAWASFQLAEVSALLGDNRSADKLLRELSSRDDLPESLGRKILSARIIILYGEGRLDKALALSDQLSVSMRAIDDTTGLGKAAYFKAIIQRAQGAYAQARTNLSQARELFMVNNYTRGLALSEYILASLNLDQGNIFQALDGFKRTEELFRKLDHKRSIAMVFLSRGAALLRIAKTAQARKELQTARRLYAEVQDFEGLLYVKIYTAEADLEDGAYEQAAHELSALNAEFDARALAHQKSLISFFLARAYVNLHRLDEAEEFLSHTDALQFKPFRDLYRLLPAHLAYERHHFSEAVRLATAVKAQAEDWSGHAEKLFTTYKKAAEQKSWVSIAL